MANEPRRASLGVPGAVQVRLGDRVQQAAIWHAAGFRAATGPLRGSGIFLHVQGSGATAGCVAVPEARALSFSQWLDPAKRPVMVIGEDDWLKAA
jgi:hypothetical protein